MGTIACECSAIGALSKMLIEDSGAAPRTFVTGSERLEFIFEQLGTVRAIQYSGAITGSLTRYIRGARKKSYLVQGAISVQPSAGLLNLWLPRIFGGPMGIAGSGSGWDPDADSFDQDCPLTNTIPSWDALVYRENGIFQYTNCKVAQAYLRGRSSNGGNSIEFLELVMVIVGEQEIITQSGDASPWPATEPILAVTPQFDPYAVWETDILLNGVNIPFNNFTLAVNNNLSVSFYNELYPQCIRSTGRDIKLDIGAPLQCPALAEAIDMNDTDGTASVRMANLASSSDYHSEIHLPYAMNHFKTPVTRGRGEIELPISVEAFGFLGLDEAVITNDIQ